MFSQSTCTCCFLFLTWPTPGPPANVFVTLQPWLLVFHLSRGIRHTIYPEYCERERTQLQNTSWPGDQTSWIVLSFSTGIILQHVLMGFTELHMPFVLWPLAALDSVPAAYQPQPPSPFLFLEASDTLPSRRHQTHSLLGSLCFYFLLLCLKDSSTCKAPFRMAFGSLLMRHPLSRPHKYRSRNLLSCQGPAPSR